MKQVFLSTTTEFKEIDTLEPGTWINLVNPTQNESLEIANAFDIDIADLRAPLDAEKSLTPSTLTLPTFEHRSMRKKCPVLPSKMSTL